MKALIVVFLIFLNSSLICQDVSKDQQEMSDALTKKLLEKKSSIAAEQESFAEYGNAFLKRIRNSSNFPLELSLASQSNSALLPDGTVVRLKIKSDIYGDKKPFLQIINESPKKPLPERLVVRMNNLEANKTESHFVVSNLSQGGKNYLGLSPVKFPNKKIAADFLGEDPFVVSCFNIDFFDKNIQNPAWWILHGNLEKGYLQNALTKGFLGPNEYLDDNLPGSTENIFYFDFNHKFADFKLSELSLADLTKVDVSKNLAKAYQLYHQNLKLLLKSPKDTTVETSLNSFDKKIKMMIQSLQRKNQISCNFGDLIQLRSFSAYQVLSVVEDDYILKLQESNPFSDDNLFFFKGEHSDSDRYNCQFGQAITQGALVRLEHARSGKNLSVSKNLISVDKKIKIKSEVADQDYQRFALELAGSNGIGSLSDNWYVSIVGSQDELALGSQVVLMHPSSGTILCAESIFEEPSSLRQVVCAIKKASKDLAKEQNEVISSSTAALEASLSSNDLSSANFDLSEKDSEQTKQQKILKQKAASSVAEKDPLFVQKQWLIDRVQKLELDQKDLARTGFLKGSPFERIGTKVPNNQEVSIEVVAAGGKRYIQKKTDFWTDELGKSKGFELSSESVILKGFYSSYIKNFLPGMSALLTPMLNQGIVWLEKSLFSTNKFFVRMLLKINDIGDFSIVLGDKLNTNFEYKVCFGQNDNKNTAIVKRALDKDGGYTDTELINILNREQIDAGFAPGVVTPIWLSFDNGVFLVGRSTEVGENVFLAYSDLDFNSRISRVGFSSGEQSVFIADVEIGAGVELLPPRRRYTEFDVSEDLKNDGMLLSNQGFRQSDELFFQFECKSLIEEVIYLGSKNDPFYKLTFNFFEGKISLEKKEGSNFVKKFSTNNSLLQKRKAKAFSFWISYSQGNFFAGIGAPSENPIFVYSDKKPSVVGYFALAKESRVSKISSFSKIGITSIFASSDITNDSKESNPLYGIIPFNYSVSQIDDRLEIKDMIDKQSYLVATMPQKNADYTFVLELDEKGLPKARWMWQPENADLIKKKWKMKFLELTAGALQAAASHIEGSGSIGQTVGALASLSSVAASLPIADEAAKAKAEVLLDTKKEFDQSSGKQAKSISKTDIVSVQAQDLARKNRLYLESMLDEVQKVSASTKDNFFAILGKYKKMASLITHGYVIGNKNVKKQMIDGVDDLLRYRKELFDQKNVSFEDNQFDSSSNEVVDLLISLNQNTYFFDKGVPQDQSKQKSWLAEANSIFLAALQENPDKEVNIPALNGKLFWLKDKLPKKSFGTVSFRASGSGNLVITLAQSPGSVDLQEEVYQITIFNEDNFNDVAAGLQLYSQSAFAKKVDNEDALLNFAHSKYYKVELKDSKISLYVGQSLEDMKLVFEFLDPFPKKAESYIAFGAIVGEVKLAELKIYEPGKEQANLSE